MVMVKGVVTNFTAMKILLNLCVMLLLTFALSAQAVLEDEMLQARVHYMNDAKVSYLAAVEVSTDLAVAYRPVIENEEVPEEIKTSFLAKYEKAKQVEWTVKEDRYKVSFVFEGQGMFAYIDRHGHWIKSFTKLVNNELPEMLSDYLSTNYPGYQLAKYYLKETPNGSSYTLAVKKEGIYIWLEFDLQGKIKSNQA